MENRILVIGLILVIISAVFACGCMDESKLRHVEEPGAGHNYLDNNYPDADSYGRHDEVNERPTTPKGSISITSDPSGANVHLDGTYMGKTPISLDNVVSGSHTIELTKSGYKSKMLAVSLSAGGAENIRESLEPLTGSISISSDPSGANIYLDGMYKGTAPTTISGLLSGSHTIRLEKDGYEDFSESVSVTADVTTPLTANLILKLIPCTVTVPDIVLTNYRPPGWSELFVNYGSLTYSETFEIYNPNQIPVYLDRIDYIIYMHNVSVSEGTYSKPDSIPARGRKPIEVRGEIVISCGGDDIQIVLGALSRRKVDARLSGRVYFKDTEYGPLPSGPFNRILPDVPVT